MKRKINYLAVTFAAATVLTLSACDSDEKTDNEEPLSKSEQAAKDDLEESQGIYDETYEDARALLIEDYGITETADLCDANVEFSEDYEAEVEDIVSELGEEPADNDAFDAVDDAVTDMCDDLAS